MKMRLAAAGAMLAALACIPPASAATFSFTGSLDDPNDVQFFSFTINEERTVVIRTWSYAGGINGAGVTIPDGGFDPIVAIFQGDPLALVAQNDDDVNPLSLACLGNVNLGPGGACFDSYLEILLNAGTYSASITPFPNFYDSNPIEGPPGFFNIGDFNNRTACWALDIGNADNASTVGNPGVCAAYQTPEPAAIALFGGAMLGLGLLRRRRSV
jgi:hypothetical protein